MRLVRIARQRGSRTPLRRLQGVAWIGDTAIVRARFLRKSNEAERPDILGIKL
jgi:hypothetical protein